ADVSTRTSTVERCVILYLLPRYVRSSGTRRPISSMRSIVSGPGIADRSARRALAVAVDHRVDDLDAESGPIGRRVDEPVVGAERLAPQIVRRRVWVRVF